MEARRRVVRCLASGSLVFASSFAWTADLTVPNTFVQGQPAVANDVNQNFSATATAVNSKQDRVIGTCPSGQAIRIINQNGTVTCDTASNNRLVTLENIVNSVPIFDNRDASPSSTARAAGSSIGVLINVAANTTITRISVLNQINADGNLRFVIFDHPTHNRLLLTNPQPVRAESAPTLKDSVAFTFTLLAGQSYDIGAIADVAASWFFDVTPNTQLNITSVSQNANFSDFNNPSQIGHAGADANVRLNGLLP